MLPRLVNKALSSYQNQQSRCRNSKIRAYRDYGAKGIRVEYTVRQFVAWYLKNIKSFKGKQPVVGRKNHSKNYKLGNIEILSRSENSSEAMARTSHRFSFPVVAFKRKSGLFVGEFKSMKEASVACGNSFSSVQRICNKRVKNPRTKFLYYFKKEFKNGVPKLFIY